MHDLFTAVPSFVSDRSRFRCGLRVNPLAADLRLVSIVLRLIFGLVSVMLGLVLRLMTVVLGLGDDLSR